MITIVQGTLGGGKTLRGVREIASHLARGLFVYTNIEYVFSGLRVYCRAAHRVEIQRKQIRRLPPMEDVKDWVDAIEFASEAEPILVVIDESAIFWNSRDWAETQKHQKNMLAFLRQSRKAGVNICFIAQESTDLDKQFRNLAELLINCRNMAKIKVPVINVPLLGLFRYHVIEVSKQGGIRDLVISAEWWWALGRNKLLFNCYKTEAFLDSYMTELAATKKRLGAVKLERATLLRRISDGLRVGWGPDKIAGRWLRSIICSRLKEQRRLARVVES